MYVCICVCMYVNIFMYICNVYLLVADKSPIEKLNS